MFQRHSTGFSYFSSTSLFLAFPGFRIFRETEAWDFRCLASLRNQYLKCLSQETRNTLNAYRRRFMFRCKTISSNHEFRSFPLPFDTTKSTIEPWCLNRSHCHCLTPSGRQSRWYFSSSSPSPAAQEKYHVHRRNRKNEGNRVTKLRQKKNRLFPTSARERSPNSPWARAASWRAQGRARAPGP